MRVERYGKFAWSRVRAFRLEREEGVQAGERTWLALASSLDRLKPER